MSQAKPPAERRLGDGIYASNTDGCIRIRMEDGIGDGDIYWDVDLPTWLSLVAFANNNMPLEFHVGTRRPLGGGNKARRKAQGFEPDVPSKRHPLFGRKAQWRNK